LKVNPSILVIRCFSLWNTDGSDEGISDPSILVIRVLYLPSTVEIASSLRSSQ
jgi:hypothetical protein